MIYWPVILKMTPPLLFTASKAISTKLLNKIPKMSYSKDFVDVCALWYLQTSQSNSEDIKPIHLEQQLFSGCVSSLSLHPNFVPDHCFVITGLRISLQFPPLHIKRHKVATLRASLMLCGLRCGRNSLDSILMQVICCRASALSPNIYSSLKKVFNKGEKGAQDSCFLEQWWLVCNTNANQIYIGEWDINTCEDQATDLG